MRIEHFAYMVRDPKAVSDWYCTHLGFVVARKSDEGPMAHFLRDSAGTSMMEIYNNSQCTVPDYASMDPLMFHIAFVCDDVDGTVARLDQAGATLIGEITRDTDTLAMMRDPWGLAIQFCDRADPML